MRVGPTVILLVGDADAAVDAIAEALVPCLDSNLTREVTAFELSLEKHGIKGGKATGDIVQFHNPQGSPQVSVLLVPNYEPPVAACAAYQILESIAIANSCKQFTIIIPYILPVISKRQSLSSTSPQDIMIYADLLGAQTELTEAIIAETTMAPPLSIACETVACFLQIARALKFPAVLLVASPVHSHTLASSSDQLEATSKVGQFLASHVGLCFCRDKIQHAKTNELCPQKERQPWQDLYG